MDLIVRAKARTYLRSKGFIWELDLSQRQQRDLWWIVEAAGVGLGGMDVGAVCEVLADGVGEGVLELVAKVFLSGDAMRVVAVLPDLAGCALTDREGEAALDELCAAFDRPDLHSPSVMGAPTA